MQLTILLIALVQLEQYHAESGSFISASATGGSWHSYDTRNGIQYIPPTDCVQQHPYPCANKWGFHL